VPRLEQEMWFANQVGKVLKVSGMSVAFEGITTPSQRADRIRFAIVSRGMGDWFCGKLSGHSITFGEMYQRLYGVAL
jgi:hypothetical protein